MSPRQRGRTAAPFSLALLLSLAAAINAGSSVPCVIPATAAGVAETDIPTLRACFSAVPANATTTQQTLETARGIVSTYSFTDLLKETGPPWQLRIDAQALLDDLGRAGFSGDFELHEALNNLFASFHDAHTQYLKPACYSADVLQPVGLTATLVANRLVLRTASLLLRGVDVTARYAPDFPTGAEIVAIDGVGALTALNRFAESIPDGSDAASRFTAVINRQAFSYRNTMQRQVPTAANVSWTLRDATGNTTTYPVPWRVYVAPSDSVANFTRSCVRVVQPAANCSAASAHDPANPLQALARRLAAQLDDSGVFANGTHPGLGRDVDDLSGRGSGTTSPHAEGSRVRHIDTLLRELQYLAGLPPGVQRLWEPILAIRAVHGELRAETERRRRLQGGTLGPSVGDLEALATLQQLPASAWAAAGLHAGVWAAGAAGAVAPYAAAVLASASSGRLSTQQVMQLLQPAEKAAAVPSLALGADGLSLADVISAGVVASGSVQVLSDRSGTMGTLLLWDSGLQALRLRVSTFLPPAVSACSSGLGPCATAAQLAAYSRCVGTAADGFLAAVSTDVWSNWASLGAKALLVDLTSNGGGFVSLGQATMLSLVAALYRAPYAANPVFDVRSSPLYASTLAFLQANPAVNDTTPSLTGYYRVTSISSPPAGSTLTRGGLTTAPVRRADVSWYSPGSPMYRGPGVSAYSVPMSLFDSGSVQAYAVAAPPVPLDSSNLVLLTDGLCGSMCGQFLRTLHVQGLARVLGVGGLPGSPGDTTSFIGGFVLDSNALGQGLAAMSAAGWVPPPNVSVIRQQAHSGYWTVNFGAMEALVDPSAYEQYRSKPADLQLHVWGSLATASNDAALRSAAAALLAMPVQQPDGTFVSGADLGGGSTRESEYRAAAIALGALCVVLGLCLTTSCVLLTLPELRKSVSHRCRGCCFARSSVTGRRTVWGGGSMWVPNEAAGGMPAGVVLMGSAPFGRASSAGAPSGAGPARPSTCAAPTPASGRPQVAQV